MPLLPSPSDRSKASSGKLLQKHRRDENSTEDAERPINPDRRMMTSKVVRLFVIDPGVAAPIPAECLLLEPRQIVGRVFEKVLEK